MQAYDIALPENLIERYHVHALGRHGVFAVGDHLHPKCRGDFRYLRADISKADQSHCFSCQLGQRGFPVTEIGRSSPFACKYALAVRFHAVHDRQQQCESLLRHRSRTVGFHIGDGNALFSGCFNIDVIETRRHYPDILHIRQLRQRFSGKHNLIHQQYFRLTGPLHNLLPGRTVIDSYVAQFFNRCPVLITRVQSISVENYDVHALLFKCFSKMILYTAFWTDWYHRRILKSFLRYCSPRFR